MRSNNTNKQWRCNTKWCTVRSRCSYELSHGQSNHTWKHLNYQRVMQQDQLQQVCKMWHHATCEHTTIVES